MMLPKPTTTTMVISEKKAPILTAAAPLTHAWYRRVGALSIAVLTAAAVAVDIARFAFDVPGIGWINFIFVWAAVHQIGPLVWPRRAPYLPAELVTDDQP